MNLRLALAGIIVQTGRKCSAQEDEEMVESQLRIKALVRTVAIGWDGLGAKNPSMKKLTGKSGTRSYQRKCRLVLKKEITSGWLAWMR